MVGQPILFKVNMLAFGDRVAATSIANLVTIASVLAGVHAA
ncbi:hypothetical protein [Inquilinus sp. CA228]